jgi:hypothetical protein
MLSLSGVKNVSNSLLDIISTDKHEITKYIHMCDIMILHSHIQTQTVYQLTCGEAQM